MGGAPPPPGQGYQAPGTQDMSHGQHGGAPPNQFNQGFSGAPQPPRPVGPGMQPGIQPGMQQPQKKLDPDQMPSPVSNRKSSRNCDC